VVGPTRLEKAKKVSGEGKVRRPVSIDHYFPLGRGNGGPPAKPESAGRERTPDKGWQDREIDLKRNF